MTKIELLERQQIRKEYATQIQSKIKNRHESVPLETLESLYQNIPPEMRTLVPQTERLRLDLDPNGRHGIQLALAESKYRAETILVRGRPYPIRIFHDRYSTDQITLNWTQSYRIALPNKKPMTLDILYGEKNIIAPKGKFIGTEGLQSGERVVDDFDRPVSEQNVLKLRPIGQSGYYAIANRNFLENRSLPSGLHFQRFILGQNTRQSLLRAACYLAQIANYNDWRVTQTIYRFMLRKWLSTLRDATHPRGFQGIGITNYRIDELSTDPSQELDTNPEYHKLIRNETELFEQHKTLEHLNTAWALGDPKHEIRVIVTPNLLGPFHIYHQAVSVQSTDTHTQGEHQHNIEEAIKSLIHSND